MGFQSFMQILHVVDEVIQLSQSDTIQMVGSPNLKMGRTHACPYQGCECVYSKKYRLKDHMNTHTGELPFKCEVPGCEKQYHIRSSLRRHVQQFHECNTLYTTFLRCPYPNCGKVLRNKANLDKHYQRLHSGQFKYVCQYCDKGFNKDTQMQSHVYHHTGIPPLRCATCDAGFVYQRDLNRHLRGHRKWECDIDECGKIFADWNSLRKHLSTDHSGEFECDECKRTFKTKYAIRLHVLSHLETTQREVEQCPYCDRYYFHRKNLQHHIHVKHIGRFFECSVCHKRLTTNANLRKHMKSFHEQRPQPVQVKKQTIPRKIRKDAGIPHRSMAAKLSGATIPHEEEKRLLANEYKSTSEVDPVVETDATIYSTYQAAKQRTALKRKLSEMCVGCGSGCTNADKVSSQTPKVPEATAVSVRETQKASLKMQNLPQSSAPKCDIDRLHTETRNTSSSSEELDANSEKLSENYTDSDDDSDACTSPGNLQNTKLPDCEYTHAHGELQKIPNIENDKESLEYGVMLEETINLCNGKDNCTPKNKENEHCGSDVTLDKNCTKDALHDQDPKKEWRQVYNIKKWLLVMTGMMELMCPSVSSAESLSRTSVTP